ncbi:rabenosyn-5 [Contarinia nasturtii]|uniref:rabenosyn-5 n=1 Tax=Contarinia nasturtii TaxID=265458 RepID=UPI0012D3D8F6|nr:rabenosyn-5 [Contarinia nasturtii]
MSNPFGDAFDEKEEVMEGFLCPICKADFRSPDRLTAHFDTHSEDDQDLLKAFKDIFISAKNKITRFDDGISPNNQTASAFQPGKLNIPAPVYPQDVGVDCSHISYFRAIRTPRLERYATETNKLIIRLHKLLTDLPSDQSQRRNHEKSIVPWLDGEAVKLCPNCVKRFYLTRRQHHCRLCGSIMCHDCSLFLDLSEASGIVNPSFSPTTAMPVDNKKPDEPFRICEHCLHLLNNRKEMQDSRTFRPPVTLYYEKIEQLKRDIAPDTKMYEKIIDRLYEGDSIYTLSDASALRAKIGRTAELIDAYSKSILSLQCAAGSREEALKKAIRLACIKYIKDDLLTLSPLPLEDDIQRLQDKRRMETEMKIERERRLAMEAIERSELVGGTVPVFKSQTDKGASGMALKSLDNWSGLQALDTSSSMNDPLVEQINIIKGYVKQAREALRFEEVETLELNLRELQEEFYNRQKAKDQHNQNKFEE